MPNLHSIFKRSRTALLLQEPFFGALSLKLTPVIDTSIDTACTNGTHLKYNPNWFHQLPFEEQTGLIAHEVLHCSNGHIWRRDGRDPKRWNQACDYVVNQMLLDAGFKLPKGALLDPAYKGMNAEAVYGSMPQPEPDDSPNGSPGDSSSSGAPEPQPYGEIEDPSTGDSPSNEPGDSPTEDDNSEESWKQATLQAAMQANALGKLPAGTERTIAAIKEPPCRNLTAALKEFVEHAAHNDYSWTRPNRRYLHIPLYLPSLFSENLPPIVCGVDTSGSITPDLLNSYVGALQTILDESRPSSLHVIAADAEVQAQETYEPGDTVTHDPSAYAGGGGTDFRPVFNVIADLEPGPCCCVYLTDLEGTFPESEPDTPTLWVVYDPYTQRKKAPYGQTIYLSCR